MVKWSLKSDSGHLRIRNLDLYGIYMESIVGPWRRFGNVLEQPVYPASSCNIDIDIRRRTVLFVFRPLQIQLHVDLCRHGRGRRGLKDRLQHLERSPVAIERLVALS